VLLVLFCVGPVIYLLVAGQCVYVIIHGFLVSSVVSQLGWAFAATPEIILNKLLPHVKTN
jgi:hypothetical protein